jgi:Xaa-Pro dipeptidase
MNMLLNQDRAQEFLESNNVSAIISSARENTTYLTDFLAVDYIHDRMASGPGCFPGSGSNYLQTYGIFTREGERVLIIPQSRFLFIEPDTDVEIYTYGPIMSLRERNPKFDTEQERIFENFQNNVQRNFNSHGEALSAAIREFVKGNIVGLDYSDIHSSALRSLRDNNSNVVLKDASESFRFLRMVKSKAEIRRLEKAAEITEKALETTLQSTHEGVSEEDLRVVFAASVSANGATFDNEFMSPIGSRSGSIAAPSNIRKIMKGDIGWFDFGCTFLGYHSDTGESFCIGKPPERQLKIYRALEELVNKCLEIAAPGVKCTDLSDEVVKIWDKHDVTRPPTGMGHGIGLETHEYPVIASQGSIFLDKESIVQDDLLKISANMPMEEGMVLNFEAPYMIWGWGGVHIEKTAVVEKNRCTLITPQERQLRIIISK